MNPPLLTPKLISQLRSLLSTGFVADNGGELESILNGVAHPVGNKNNAGWVVSNRLLSQQKNLANRDEMVCALLALIPDVRKSWLSVAAARCKEAGSMSDSSTLIQLVSALGDASSWVEESLSQANGAATTLAAIERECVGISFEQSTATPLLMRVLAVAYTLSQLHSEQLPLLAEIDQSGMDARNNWCKGRMLTIPGVDSDSNYMLHGDITASVDISPLDKALKSPWALLLTMIVYAQDTWKAESRGGLLLQLPSGQQAFNPHEISVIILGVDGDEVRCGTLADLILKVLSYLGVHCFPYTPEPHILNQQLSPLINTLIKNQIWQYQEGGSAQNGQYHIHPVFADTCFRLPGSKLFNRTGRLLWQSVRICAESLYKERRNALLGLNAENQIRE